MQSAIIIGRKIRDNKNKSIKTPLSKVTVVTSDKETIDDLSTLKDYIKDELNCLDFEIQEKEDEYVEYLTEPDHKLIGQALKAKYNKVLKERLHKLTRSEVLEYLKNGKVTIEGVEVQEGWLKISKQFNEKYQKMADLGVDSNIDTSIMLDLVIDEKLMKMGMTREIVNRVQKLRK